MTAGTYRLTARQKRFASEYLIDLNGTRAAIRAGYAASSAAATAVRLLQMPKVAELIERGQADRAARTNVTADRVLMELSRIAFANMSDYIVIQPDGSAYVDLTDLDDDKTAALQEITTDCFSSGRGDAAREVKRVRVKLCDKLQALEKIGRHLGMFKDQMTIGGQLTISHEQALEDLE